MYEPDTLWVPLSLDIAPPDTFPLLHQQAGGDMLAAAAIWGLFCVACVIVVALWAFRGYLPERPKWRGW